MQENNITGDTPRKRKKEMSSVFALKRAGVMLFFFFGGLVALIFTLSQRPKISIIENRTLASFPDFSVGKYFSGEFTSAVENWYNDTVPGRETFKNYIADIQGMFGTSSGGAKIHGGKLNVNNDAAKKKEAAVTKKPDDDSAAAGGSTATSVTPEDKDDPLDDPNINGEISNNILVYDNRGIMLYGGSYDNCETYAKYVNNFKEDLGSSVNVYSMVCPTPVSFYLPKKYEDMSSNEGEYISYINERLKNVAPVDAIAALEPHKDEKIYENTDHHWSQLGAFYAAEAFAKQAGAPYADLSAYDKVVKDGYVGTLYGFTGDSSLSDNPEQFIYYIPKAKYKTEFWTPDFSERWDGSLVVDIDSIDVTSWYCVFIGSDDCVTHVKTEVHNGKKLAVIKDSYGNALIPCLTSSFEDIYVIDMRYFEANAISKLKEWKVTDLLFAMNTFSATGENFECIEQIRTQ